MKKVLIIIGEINKAGIANAALNFYRACTKYYKDEIRFDFVTTVEPNNELRKEFEENKTQYFLIKRIKFNFFQMEKWDLQELFYRKSSLHLQKSL